MLGVRLPQLRAMAAVIAKEDARGFLESCDFSSMEMTTLYGFVLGRLRGEIGEALARRAQTLLGEVRAKLDAAQAEQAASAQTAGTQSNLD